MIYLSMTTHHILYEFLSLPNKRHKRFEWAITVISPLLGGIVCACDISVELLIQNFITGHDFCKVVGSHIVHLDKITLYNS
jgi:hypothetical protein